MSVRRSVGLLCASAFLASLAVPAYAGQECVTVEGNTIRAGDLARAWGVLRKLPADQALALSPAAGVRRQFSAADLRRLAERYSLAVEAAASPPENVCVELASEELTPERVRSALEAALDREGVPSEGRKLELIDFSRNRVPRGALEFSLGGLSRPSAVHGTPPAIWRGRVRYAGRRSAGIWARVQLSVPRTRVVAAQNLAVSVPIQAGQVQLATVEEFPAPSAAAQAQTLTEVVGQLPRRPIRAGDVIQPAMLVAPREVERGATVSVEVRSGAALLSFEARAESGGRTGDTIVVRNPDNGRRFRARVERRGQVVVEALETESNRMDKM